MQNSNIAFENLRAEMARSNVLIKDIALSIGISRSTAGAKLSQKYPISLSEAFKIKTDFFPDKDIGYLFSELDNLSRTGGQ